MVFNFFSTVVLRYGAKVLHSFAFGVHGIAERLNKISWLTGKERAILKRNEVFRDKHKGRRAFVIVNGPSLKDQDITLLKNELTFVVSGFYKHEVIKTWQPSYYCILDEYFFNGSEQSKTFFETMKETIKTSIFFIPLFRGHKANVSGKLLPDDRTFYVATAGSPNNDIDMTGVVQAFQSVSAFALAQAVYMGCDPIYLLGFDHDYLANRGMDRHFYTGGTVANSPAAAKTIGDRFSYDQDMKAFIRLWANYRSLHRIAAKKGIRIYNATRGGYLDVYERADYEKLGLQNKDAPNTFVDL